MNQLFPLIRIMLKSSFGQAQAKKTSTGRKVGMIALGIILGISLIPMAAVVYMLAQMLFTQLYVIQQEGLVFQIIFLMITLTVFIFSLLSIPGVYYFTKDIESYLVMPIKSEIIVIARFIVALLYEYAITLFLFIPATAAYFSVTGFSLVAALICLIIAIVLPIIPLILASIIVMLLFVGVPFIKNKDAYTYLISGFAILFSLGINFFSQRLALADPTIIAELFQEGSNSLIKTVGQIMPHLSFGSYAIVNHSLLDLVIFLAIHAVLFALFIWIAQRIYFKGASGINESGSKHKRLNRSSLSKSSQAQSVYIRYMLKDWNTLVRTPVYFLNSISSIFIFPLLFIIYILAGTIDMDTLQVMSRFILEHPNILFIAGNVGLILGLFTSSLNSVSATILTREGQNIFFMKMIPVPIFSQVLAKISVGILLSFASFVLMAGAIIYILGLPVYIMIVILLNGLIGILLSNFVTASVDIHSPKLNWDNENQAMKQNMNVAFSALAIMSIAVVIGLITFTLRDNSLHLTLVTLTCVILTYIAFIYLKKISHTHIEMADF